jgi:hypothetical protein
MNKVNQMDNEEQKLAYVQLAFCQLSGVIESLPHATLFAPSPHLQTSFSLYEVRIRKQRAQLISYLKNHYDEIIATMV